MQTSDVVIAGAGIIGLSVAIELTRAGASVTVLDRGEPGREASSAAAGMLVTGDPSPSSSLKTLADASSAMYPSFVEELELRSGLKVEFESRGALYVPDDGEEFPSLPLSRAELHSLEPDLAEHERIYFLNEQSVNPELLVQAAIGAAKQMGVIVHHESPVTSATLTREHQLEIRTNRRTYLTPTFLNCAGAWSAQIEGCCVPARPRKGQMLSVIPKHCNLSHVVRSKDVYLVPRRDSRIIIGATVEDVGFDKAVDPTAIQALHQAAADLIPSIGEAKMHAAWAGLRPGSPDDLPIMGPLTVPGTYAATGHFRNGILLAPITGALMAEVIQGKLPCLDISPFSPARFVHSKVLAG